MRVLAGAGVEVRGVVRRPVATTESPMATVEDWRNLSAAGTALDGARVVVHAAGVAHRSGPGITAADFHRGNVALTAAVLEAAGAAGVQHFLYLSSVAAVGERAGADGAPITESTCGPPATAYGASKLAAEELVRAAGARTGMIATALRPPMIYGEGMKGNPLRLFDLVARGLPVPVGTPAVRRSTLYVGNLAAAVLAVIGAGAASDGTFLVADAEAPTAAELARQVAAALGRPARIWPTPTAVLRVLGRAGDVLERVVPMPLTTAKARSLSSALVLDTSRLAARTGHRPPFTLEAGVRRTAAWYAARRLAG